MTPNMKAADLPLGTRVTLRDGSKMWIGSVIEHVPGGPRTMGKTRVQLDNVDGVAEFNSAMRERRSGFNGWARAASQN